MCDSATWNRSAPRYVALPLTISPGGMASASVSPKGGMIVDFADLKAQTRAVLAQYDHRNWNDVLDYPSVENICALLHEQLKRRLAFPFTIRVFEGHAKWAEM